MSTSWDLWEKQTKDGGRVTLAITEQSSTFDISLSLTEDEPDDVEPDREHRYEFLEMEKLTPEAVVDIAFKMLQPTLYNVADPQAFMRDVIRPRLETLFV